MTRPVKINKEEVLERLKTGETDRAIAEVVGCKWQYVQQLRLGFTREGLLDGTIKRKGRPRKAETPREAVAIKHRRDDYGWDEIQQAVWKAFEQARMFDEIKEENWRLKNRVAELEAINKKQEKDLQWKREYENARLQGTLPAPLRAGGKAPLAKMSVDGMPYSAEIPGRRTIYATSPHFEPNKLAPENIMETSVDYLMIDDVTFGVLKQLESGQDKARFNYKNCALWEK